MYKLNTLKFFDLFALVMPLGHAIGRVGCFYSGCCYGMHYDGPFSVEYTKTLGMTPLNTPLFPIQLIEALLLMILFSVLMFMYFKMRKAGLITATYLYAYSVIRFVLEFFRGDLERGLVFGLSTSQIVSIVIVVFVTTLLIVKSKKKAVN